MSETTETTVDHERLERSLGATGVVIASPSGLIVEADEAIAAMLGYESGQLVGRPLIDLIPERFHDLHSKGFDRWSDTGIMRLGGKELSLVAVDRSGGDVPVMATLHHVDRAGGREVVAFLKPAGVDPRPHSELASSVLSLIGRQLPLDEMLEALISEISEHLGWDHGLIWLPDDFSGQLRVTAAWSRDDDGFATESADRSFAAGEGRIGSTFATSHAVWVDDVSTLADYHRADIARDHGVSSGVFFPLLAGDERIGAIELLSREPRGIDVASHEALDVLSVELGALIRQRADMERSDAQRQRLDLAVEAAELGTWTLDLARGRIEGSAQLAILHGLPPEPFTESLAAFASRVHPDHRTLFDARLEQGGRDGQRFDHVYAIVRPDGSEGWLRGAGQGLHDADGRLRSITGVAFDVSDSIAHASEQEERIRNATLVADVGALVTADWLDDAALQRVAEVVVERLDAAFARIWSVDDGGNDLVLRASAGLYTHLDGAHARVPIGRFKIGRIAERRMPHLTNGVSSDPEISDPDWAASEGMVAFAGYPLLVSGECTGVLGIFARHELTPSSLDALGSVANMLALAAARHRIFRQRTVVAEVLQRSLLPPALPIIDGLDLGVAYASSVDEVSGDFYDVYPVKDDSWAFMIGDVCGKGPTAAASTALARHTLRTAAMLESSTTAPLVALNTALIVGDGGMCTAVFGRMRCDSTGTTVDIARAGHPPPLLRRANGSLETLLLSGALVGVFPEANFAETTIRLAHGDQMVLLTDGVLESRRGDELFGEERLADVIVANPGLVADDLAAVILEAAVVFTDRPSADDIAVLVIGAVPMALS